MREVATLKAEIEAAGRLGTFADGAAYYRHYDMSWADLEPLLATPPQDLSCCGRGPVVAMYAHSGPGLFGCVPRATCAEHLKSRERATTLIALWLDDDWILELGQRPWPPTEFVRRTMPWEPDPSEPPER
jgi:hypothetical protein